MFSKEILRLFSDVLIADVINLSNYAGCKAITLFVLMLWEPFSFFCNTTDNEGREEEVLFTLAI
jgi:hypothetical protein